jgi:hypothetical protein
VSLYFCAVRTDQALYYKIGVTSRSIDERVEEIRQALRPQHAAVTVLGTWPHRGTMSSCISNTGIVPIRC